jgi:hypothetical protein
MLKVLKLSDFNVQTFRRRYFRYQYCHISILMDRLNVRNILRRKKCKLEGNNYNCPIYPLNREETTFHLFFTCPFNWQCWDHLGISWNLWRKPSANSTNPSSWRSSCWVPDLFESKEITLSLIEAQPLSGLEAWIHRGGPAPSKQNEP